MQEHRRQSHWDWQGITFYMSALFQNATVSQGSYPGVLTWVSCVANCARKDWTKQWLDTNLVIWSTYLPSFNPNFWNCTGLCSVRMYLAIISVVFERLQVDILACFRPGDIVRAEILSAGDARSFYLTTAKPELGVIFAKSLAGKPFSAFYDPLQIFPTHRYILHIYKVGQEIISSHIACKIADGVTSQLLVWQNHQCDNIMVNVPEEENNEIACWGIYFV